MGSTTTQHGARADQVQWDVVSRVLDKVNINDLPLHGLRSPEDGFTMIHSWVEAGQPCQVWSRLCITPYISSGPGGMGPRPFASVYHLGAMEKAGETTYFEFVTAKKVFDKLRDIHESWNKKEEQALEMYVATKLLNGELSRSTWELQESSKSNSLMLIHRAGDYILTLADKSIKIGGWQYERLEIRCYRVSSGHSIRHVLNNDDGDALREIYNSRTAKTSA